jgi:hypothetical protein
MERVGAAIGKGHPDTLQFMQVLADTYRGAGRMGDVEGIESEIFTRREEVQRQQVLDEMDIELGWERQDY